MILLSMSTDRDYALKIVKPSFTLQYPYKVKKYIQPKKEVEGFHAEAPS